jgi:tRNA threonylcarbamoyladenosine biosynthesis protein TsaE
MEYLRAVERVAMGEEAMVALGAEMAACLPPGAVVYLEGELGMGKTTLARGVIRARGHSGAVKSPTYTLVEPYELASGNVYHFDLYRLADPQELEYMGIRDYFEGDSLALVEWAQRGAGFLPRADLVVTIAVEGDGRRLCVGALSELGALCIAGLAGGIDVAGSDIAGSDIAESEFIESADTRVQ